MQKCNLCCSDENLKIKDGTLQILSIFSKEMLGATDSTHFQFADQETAREHKGEFMHE